MAKIDIEYHKLLETILKDGYKYEDPNRKGTFRLEIADYKIKHDFKDGFPAITTKKLYWKGVVGELLWFLRGDTNIKYLVDNGINIWNKDAYNYYLKRTKNSPHEKSNVSFIKFIDLVRNTEKNKLEWSGYNYSLGDLGRVYGAQWRSFGIEGQDCMGSYYYEGADQISNLIKGLKENPMGTKHIVTAWNPAELDEMALPPCHWSFEVIVEPIPVNLSRFTNKETESTPTYQFTLKWHQRSVDTLLG